MFGKNENQESNNISSVDTIIGPSVSVEGNFKGEGNIIIEGEVNGSLKTKGYLKASESSIIVASVTASEAEIAGRVSGNIKIRGGLEIKATAIIQGDIEAQSISVAPGAIINGNLKMKTEVGGVSQETAGENK
jgi:cytoskeletal protein CcmA (bactofilin family)